jgi:HEAT repeat protein
LKDDSALLKHELAYVLGQTGNLKAIPVLTEVLQETSEHEMVRHEVYSDLRKLFNSTSLYSSVMKYRLQRLLALLDNWSHYPFWNNISKIQAAL